MRKPGPKASQAVIVGDWDPFKEMADLYHYDAKPLPSKHEFIDKYLKWWRECDDMGKITKIKRPQVKS